MESRDEKEVLSPWLSLWKSFVRLFLALEGESFKKRCWGCRSYLKKKKKAACTSHGFFSVFMHPETEQSTIRLTANLFLDLSQIAFSWKHTASDIAVKSFTLPLNHKIFLPLHSIWVFNMSILIKSSVLLQLALLLKVYFNSPEYLLKAKFFVVWFSLM